MNTAAHLNGRIRRGRFKRAELSMAALLTAITLPAQALTITPYFGASITSDPNAGLITAAVNNAIQFYASTFSNPIDVGIVFQLSTVASNGVAFNEAMMYQPSYTSYTSALANQSLLHPENAVLATAVANLSVGKVNYKAQSIYGTSAAMRAIGFSSDVGGYGIDGVLGHGSLDGVVTLNATYPLGYSGTPGAGQYDVNMLLQHEINEVLGIGGQGSVINTMRDNAIGLGDYRWPPVIDGQSAIGPMDLYRYIPTGPTRSLTYDPGYVYFSVDAGMTAIMPFNDNSFGDYGDWANSAGCAVQGAFACLGPGPSLNLSSPEIIALQAIGYNLAPVPEPQSYALILAGLGLVGGWARRRKRNV